MKYSDKNKSSFALLHGRSGAGREEHGGLGGVSPPKRLRILLI